ncbi:SANT/Myb_domain [Hexamita inflata]|uniref:SANT/Myb domain n=1 Tax=Hexamita inflata TaxID=28002 RepID=A0AA86QE53_9EUKA|nr:SANT/Myb domain [Hexamita inflata]
MNKLITKQFQINFNILQQIHSYTHEINRIKQTHKYVQRERWTKAEDAILLDAVQIIGNRNCDLIAALIRSKTSQQIYQRLRYLRDTLNSFTPEIDLSYDQLQ